MAFSSKILLTLATVLVLAASQAHGLSIGGLNVNTMAVNVSLNCQANPAGAVTGTAAPLAGVPVTLLLNNLFPVASATTDVNGLATLKVNSAQLLALIPSLTNLKAIVNLPLPLCPILANATGVLQGAVQTVGTVVNNALNATIPTLTVGAA